MKKNKGAVLVMTLIIILILFMGTATVMSAASGSHKLSSVVDSNNKVKLVSESGIEKGLKLITLYNANPKPNNSY